MATDKAASDFVKKTLNDLNEGLALKPWHLIQALHLKLTRDSKEIPLY